MNKRYAAKLLCILNYASAKFMYCLRNAGGSLKWFFVNFGEKLYILNFKKTFIF